MSKIHKNLSSIDRLKALCQLALLGVEGLMEEL